MKREELIAMGISEENADKIMADYGSTVQKANAKAEQYKEKANKADELQTQLDELNSQNMTELEKATTALEAANKQIAQLEKNDEIRTQRAKAMEKFGLTAEQASKVVTDEGATDYEVLGQIFADSKKTAIAEYEKQKLDDTPNPGGSKGGNNGDDKPEDVKNAENISFGNVSAEQSTKDYYKI